MPEISSSIENSVGYITVDRAPNNFFDPSMIHNIVESCLKIETEHPECIAIVLRTNGKNFCAGMDMASVDEDKRRAEFAKNVYAEASRLFTVNIPLIAVVQGAAVGGGFGLACACDFRVASEGTRFIPNFTRLGIHPGFALSTRLSQLIGHARAKDILMRSITLTGTAAQELGLVDELVSDDYDHGVGQILATLRDLSPLAVRAVKRTMNSIALDSPETTMSHELAEQTRLWATEDAEEGINSLRERRAPLFVGR